MTDIDLPNVLEINGVFYETRQTSDALASLLAEARNKVELVLARLASAFDYAKANPGSHAGVPTDDLIDLYESLAPKLSGILYDLDAPRRERLRDATISANVETVQPIETAPLEALRFYAEGKHYHGDILLDRGETARAALAKAGSE